MASEQRSLGFGPTSQERNPCVRVWGRGPEGKRCKTCSHLVTRQYGRTYYKCDLRKMSACSATDHGCAWNACAKYVEADRVE